MFLPPLLSALLSKTHTVRSRDKVCGPHVVVLLDNRKRIVDWYMAILVVTNRLQGDMCYDDIGLCAHIIDMISSSNHFYIGMGLCDHLRRKRIFTLT